MKCGMAMVVLTGLVSGCASTMNVSMMARDSGRAYVGELTPNGSGGGTMAVRIDAVSCVGPAARVSSNESFGFATMYGSTTRGTSAMVSGTSVTTGDSLVKAILSCSDSRGLRCELTGRDSNGGGICVDDFGKVFDVIATRK